MNVAQRVVLISGLLLVSLVALFPPWMYVVGTHPVVMRRRAFLFNPPDFGATAYVCINYHRLALELLVIVAGTGAFFLLVGWVWTCSTRMAKRRGLSHDGTVRDGLLIRQADNYRRPIAGSEVNESNGSDVTCAHCSHRFKVKLRQRFDATQPGDREMIFNDTAVVVVCPRCKLGTRKAFFLVYVDKDHQFAVFYDPFTSDHLIDVFTNVLSAYEPYYVCAPRISDWEEFKKTIVEFETGKRRVSEAE